MLWRNDLCRNILFINKLGHTISISNIPLVDLTSYALGNRDPVVVFDSGAAYSEIDSVDASFPLDTVISLYLRIYS